MRTYLLAIPFGLVVLAAISAWVFLRSLPRKEEATGKPWTVDRDGRVRTDARPVVLKAKTKAD